MRVPWSLEWPHITVASSSLHSAAADHRWIPSPVHTRRRIQGYTVRYTGAITALPNKWIPRGKRTIPKNKHACKGDLDRRRGQRDTSRKLEDDGGGSSKEQSSRWRKAVVYFPPTGGDKAQVKYPGLLQRHCSKKGRLSEGANRTGVHWMGQRGTTTFANPLTPKNRQARYDCDWWSMVAGQWFTIVCVNTSMVGVSCCVANVFLRVVSWHFPVFNCTVCARMKLFFFLEKVVRLNTFDGICIISCSNDKNQQTVVSYGRQILKS